MGIESDQVVYEYLSRVGDVAHQRQLPSADRMRLVAALRDEIDRRRAKAVVDSPTAVRRILERIGTPDEVVEAAGTGTGTARTAEAAPGAAVPVQRESGPRPAVPRPRSEGAAPPHRAGADELGDSAEQPDWWRSDTGGTGGDEVPGFVGGVLIPDLLKRPPKKKAAETAEDAEGEAEDAEEAQEETEARPRRLRLSAVRRWNNPLLLCAAALLVAGAVLGNLVALAAGWLIAWASRRLSKAEIKAAVIVLPGLAVAAGVLWLWGRGTGRWGDPIVQGRTSDAIAETWPWVLRGAAVASALFLVWRSQRQK
ncbi:hypothetical protein [Streptomyces sp. enrichment culture]|uniref:hypothetical protein n=1 Tax=Streptomyces sp. enrichment culture TaxID=1795815 RepID=UPI003F57A245